MPAVASRRRRVRYTFYEHETRTHSTKTDHNEGEENQKTLKMKKEIVDYATVDITTVIMTIRGKRVILDTDLARIYGVPTRRLNEQVRRNTDRFPPDFAFVLTGQELADLKSQIATSSYKGNRSQIATGSQRHRDPRFKPLAHVTVCGGIPGREDCERAEYTIGLDPFPAHYSFG